MKILNLGSLNLDKTYLVGHIVRPKETAAAVRSYSCCGGKGLNQSVALARAGADVYHAGLVGRDGKVLIDTLRTAGVKTDLIRTVEKDSGQAVIQLDETGENAIIVDRGANAVVDPAYIDAVLAQFGRGDLILLQNEISHVGYAIEAAKKKEMTVAFNLSPVGEECFHYPLEKVDYFLVNELEAAALAGIDAGVHREPEELVGSVKEKYPDSRIVMTLGARGAYFTERGKDCYQCAYRVEPVDTTGAGDTFCGYFLARIAAGCGMEDALEYAAAASAIAVGREGASASIPEMREVEVFLKTRRNV